jgi:predicted pyridoxine 5'-phosphate oxidase superfamily flavin-nucleotide-binding protein
MARRTITDERTLLMPDRPGNRIADTLRNLLDDDRIALRRRSSRILRCSPRARSAARCRSSVC